MKTKKSTLFVVLALVATLVLSMACLLTACGPKEEEKVMVTVAWDIPTDVSVKAEGYEVLPTELEKDTQLVFTVTAPNGYTPVVKNGTSNVSASAGNYSVKVSKDTKISVTLNKTLSDIEVEVLKDVAYFEDYMVDETSIKVTAKYVLGDEVVTDYSISYPNGSAFVEGDTSFTVSFGGKSKTVEIAAVRAAQDFESASLEIDADGNPVLVVTGHYNAGDDKEAAKEAVEAFAKECLERGTWTQKQYKSEATINDDNSFVLKLTVLEWTASATGNHYYFRYAKNGSVKDGQNVACTITNPTCVPSSSNDDLSLTEYTGDPQIGKDGAEVYIGDCSNWNPNGCIMLVVVNANAPQFQNVSLEVKNGKPYAVFNGTGEITEEALLQLIVHLDAQEINAGTQPNGEFYIDNNAIVNADTVSIEIDAEAKTFKVYVLLEGENIADGSVFFFHLGAQDASTSYYPNVSLSGDEAANTITVGGFKFTFATATDLGLTQTWQANLLYISVTAA